MACLLFNQIIFIFPQIINISNACHYLNIYAISLSEVPSLYFCINLLHQNKSVNAIGIYTFLENSP